MRHGTKLTTPPPATPAGTVACHWDTLAAGAQAVMTVTVLPADGAGVSFTGYQSVDGSEPEAVDEAFTHVARPKADLNLQISAPVQIAVGETAALITTLNNVSGDGADGVRNVPSFSMGEFSTRNVDVVSVTATAGTCKAEPSPTSTTTASRPAMSPTH